MLENTQLNEQTLLTVISDQRENPFVVKETTESLDADWDVTTEVLNQTDAYRELVEGVTRLGEGFPSESRLGFASFRKAGVFINPYMIPS